MALIGWLLGCGGPEPAPAEASFAVVGARVFDGERVLGTPTVVVREGRVASIGDDPPSELPVVDGAGLTLLPGLVDAHVHVRTGAGLGDALRFGVTTELDMFVAPSVLVARKAQRDSLDPVTEADLFGAGTLVTAPGGHGTQFGRWIPTLDGADKADAFVAARLAEGSDWIKVAYEPEGPRPSLNREALDAVVAAARARGVLVVAHISSRVGAQGAVDAGVDGLVHTFADEPIDALLLEALVEREVFVIPTLEVIAAVVGQGQGPALVRDPRLAVRLSSAQRRDLSSRFPDDPRNRARFQPAIALDNVRAMVEAGVPILAGTDAPNPGTAFGVSLSAELSRLVDAGLRPVDALRAATSVPADAFRLAGRGRLRPGDRADLVLVEGDPTTDIDQLAIELVFKNGRPIDLAAARPGRPTLPDGVLSSFDDDASSALGSIWLANTDAIAGGVSAAQLSRGDGALRIDGRVAPGRYPWSGVGLHVTGHDLTGFRRLVIRGRGAPAELLVMLFTRQTAELPAVASLSVGPSFADHTVPLDAFRGASLDEVTGLVIASVQPGTFWFELDELRLE